MSRSQSGTLGIASLLLPLLVFTLMTYLNYNNIIIESYPTSIVPL